MSNVNVALIWQFESTRLEYGAAICAFLFFSARILFVKMKNYHELVKKKNLRKKKHSVRDKNEFVSRQNENRREQTAI